MRREWSRASTLIPPGRSHGFLLDRGEFTTIDFPGAVFTSAQGINPAGDVVGLYELPTDTDFRGYLFRQGTFFPIEIPGRSTSGRSASTRKVTLLAATLQRIAEAMGS